MAPGLEHRGGHCPCHHPGRQSTALGPTCCASPLVTGGSLCPHTVSAVSQELGQPQAVKRGQGESVPRVLTAPMHPLPGSCSCHQRAQEAPA